MFDQEFQVEFDDLQVINTGGGDVFSVNGKVGDVVLSAQDVGAATPAQVQAEATARAAADNTINQNIDTLEDAVSEHDRDIQNIENDVDEAKQDIATIETAIDKNVVNNINITASASTDTINLADGKINIKTGTTSSETIPFPVASTTSAGVMNSATYQGLLETTDIANGLLEGAVAVSNLPETPTQAQLTTAWENATGREELMNRAVIYDVTNQKLWTYYTNTSTWYPVTAGGGSVEVQPWTNTQAGIVKGSTTDGQIFAENDGTGSVNGWDEVKTDIENLENAGYQTESEVDTKIATAIASLEDDIDDLETNKQDKISDLEEIRAGAAAGAVSARSVNGNDSHVQEANEIYTTTSQSQTDAFAYRTAAGAMSINSGPATISAVYGNTVQTGHTDEVLNVTGSFQAEGTTVEFNKATWRGLELENGIYTFIYDGAWKLEGAAVVLADYGLTTTGTVTEGDSISVEYVALIIGSLSTAKPTSFKATGFNQYNATAGYAKVVGGNQYRVAGTYTQVQFATTPTGAKTPVTVENNKFTPEEDGYIFVTGSGNILVALVWSGTMDSEPYSAYSDNGFNVPTTDADGNNLPTATYGLPSVHGVRDEIDFAGKQYQQRVGHYTYSAENLATVEALGVDYIYDLNDIFYVLPDLVVYNLASAVSGVYEVNDYGTEEWVGTTVPITTVITYGNSLVDKLRRLADIQTIGEGLMLGSNGELSAAGGSAEIKGFKTLTTADYNYPTSNPASVATWKLDYGFYTFDSGVVVRDNIYTTMTDSNLFLVSRDPNSSSNRITYKFQASRFTNGTYFGSAQKVDGSGTALASRVIGTNVINNLTSTDTTDALSAAQGKILNEKIGSLEARVAVLEAQLGNA